MRDDNVNDKPSCYVIGAGPGIGQAVAMAFAHEGFDVALMARNRLRVAEACNEIAKATGALARPYACDAGNERSLRAALKRARVEVGEAQVLVFNAATTQMARPTQLTVEQLVAEFRANVAGALVCARDVAPSMIKRGRGTILLTGGGFAYEPAADYASLSVSKAGLRALAYTLAQELGAHGIHVATVTVHGFVQSGTKFDPARIAQAYVELHRQPKGHFDIETVYK
jgi:NAD(P)-dependent dehydrogenase (short-subunit alcohol dehydrogenase family)